jgi:hypothetical protein
MRSRFTWIGSLVLVAFLGFAGTAAAQILPAERDALIALYNSTNGLSVMLAEPR